MFDPVDPKQSFPDLERGILTYWKEEDMFRRSVEMREGAEEFSFYDGPPFATGLPHYGHLLAGTIKDVIPRYQTMRGKKVQRRFGWDCHGLPIENLIEKEHDIKTKQDIEAMGVRTFNELCRGSVQRYAKEWKSTVERVGRWVDMDWDYKTMDATFMESIWWVFQSLYDKHLIYEGHKPMHICPRCVTPLSNFEVTQGYKDVTDQSATVLFKLIDHKDTYLLAWTTTPWTLPGNLFVAAGPDIEYVLVEFDGKHYIVAKERAEVVFKNKECIQKKSMKGSTLIGEKYEPLFPYYVQEYPTAFRVVAGDFVETTEGTGLVHIAPGFGEDDFAVGKNEGVSVLQHIGMDGRFLPQVKDFAGLDVKPSDDPSKTDKKIVEWLEKQAKLFSKENYRHSYPHCWRCDSPLLNYATSSWFVRVEKIKKDMLDANAKTAWVPAHIRDGRFGNWLNNARDWAISRNRYWGTPLPIWRCADTGDIEVIGSRDDLMRRSLLRFTKITMVRHGEAEHNVGRFYQGAIPGVHLTANGKKQAKKAGEFLSTQNVRIVYCSPLHRTRETAQAIADATGAEVIIDERLREVDCGEYEGKAFDISDLALRKLHRQKKLQSGAPESVFHLEGMEKWVDIEKRIASFFNDILQKHRSEHVVVVTHADPVVCARHYFTKEDPFKLSHRPLPTYATPESYFWDHDHHTSMDLHKENVDEITYAASNAESAVEVVCVRHGETDWNKERKIQGGNADIPLNDKGRGQIRDLAVKLAGEKFDVILTSDLQRAQESADILGKALNIDVAVLPTLRERDAGDWSGKTIDDVVKLYPGSNSNMNMAFHYGKPKNGETLSDFIARIKQAYEEIQKKYAGKRILLVCHRGTIQALKTLAENLSFEEAINEPVENGQTVAISLQPFYKRIPDVLDCWFESGSMPYAQQHFPFEMHHHGLGILSTNAEGGRAAAGESSSDAHLAHEINGMPPGFPADFIAEGIDQTRGWFYTLTVLSAALYQEPSFKNCVVNGIVLAEDGRKMSKRLKNYPEPTEVVEKYGADALRFTLMRSPAVRGEDLRFSEKMVEETLRNVLLPLWNSYCFFVTYAKLAKFEPTAKHKSSAHPLDTWIKAEVQDLINRMTTQMDAYDLSATCEELFETIDALTNWYIRLSRRRFAGKGMATETEEAEPENFEQDRIDALNTLYDVLISLSQVLAPFCPFVTDAIYLNLVPEDHGSVHLTDWPAVVKLSKQETALIAKNRVLRRVVSLGLKIRSDKKIKIRTPLAKVTVAIPEHSMDGMKIGNDVMDIVRQELNVKEVEFVTDAGKIAEIYVMVDARKAGPRLGKRVQEVIQAGKHGDFELLDDGRIAILDETLGPDEAALMYRGAEGQDVAGEHGVVVSLDTHVTEELEREGLARDLIRAIQKLRKEQGYALGERVEIGVKGADAIVEIHRSLIESETSVHIGTTHDSGHAVDVGDLSVTVFMHPKQ